MQSVEGRKKLNAARQFILQSIEKAKSEGIGKLPSHAILAKQSGVSRFTIWEAIRQLKQEKVIDCTSGGRILLKGVVESIPEGGRISPGAVPLRKTKFRDVASWIRRDVLNGRFALDMPLPSKKELCAAYGISLSTLRKSLRGLVCDGFLHIRGSQCIPCTSVRDGGSRSLRVILLGHGLSMGLNMAWGYWHLEYFRHLELECVKRGVRLEPICFYRESDELKFLDERNKRSFDLRDTSDIAGFIVEVFNSEAEDEGLLQLLSQTGKPVAVLDEMGSWPERAFLRRYPAIRVFRNTVTDAPAKTVARFILEQGHRNAVFISPYNHLEYSSRRLNALASCFDESIGAKLTPVVACLALDGHENVAFEKAQLPEFMKEADAWMAALPRAYRSYVEVNFRYLKTAILEGFAEECLYSLFESALAVRGATVWIMVNDFCAKAALDFLSEKGIPVPEKLSLVSFDDLPIWWSRGITSYNFNMLATVSAMVHYTLNPKRFPPSNPVIELEGWIVQRQTVGRCNV